MLVLHDPTTLLHETVELLGAKLIPALESPDRIKVIVESLTKSDKHQVEYINFKSASQDYHATLSRLLEQSHDHGYLEHIQTAHKNWVSNGLIKEDESVLPECFIFPTKIKLANGELKPKPPKDVFARPGYYSFDMSSGLCKDSWLAIEASANLAVEAARTLTKPSEAPANSVLALCRPPGHHCNSYMTGGYCYLNNAVVAVDAIRDFTSSNPRIAILDIDFHHGNGTQDVFYSDPSVLYLSIHGEDEYPYYSGFKEEIGLGAGEGFNFNYPLPTGSTFAQYLEKLKEAMSELVKFAPEYLLVSLGIDTFHLDPLGNFQIETEDYEVMASTIRGVKGILDIPSLILLEGGYVLDRLGPNLTSFLVGWENK